MKPSARITLAAGVSLLLLLVASAFALHQVDQIRSRVNLQEGLYMMSPKVAKRLSLGYDGLLADVYWTWAVQYFGARHVAGSRHYELLGPLLEIATTLDPHLTVAYQFGGNFLAPSPPYGAGLPQQAIQLTEYGIHNNPNEWRLYYNLGFIYYLELRDYEKAAEAFASGAKVPGAHPFLRVMAAQMAQHAGELPMAKMLWTIAYQSAEDRDIRNNAASHLLALQAEEDIINLEKLTSLYRERAGHWPSNFSELEATGMLQALPLDPLGQPYKLEAAGRVEVREPNRFPFLEKGSAAGYLPPSAKSSP
jgi:tetratricopeptide (TPR) repeat protein